MSDQPTHLSALQAAVRDGVARAVGAIGLAGIALIHTLDAPSHFVGGSDTWLGVAYVGLIASSLVLALALIASSHSRVWGLAGLLVLTTVIGFLLSRTTGLPGDSGDVGNWGENLGIASLFVEGTVLMLVSGVLLTRHAILPAQNRRARGAGSRAVPTSPRDRGMVTA